MSTTHASFLTGTYIVCIYLYVFMCVCASTYTILMAKFESLDFLDPCSKYTKPSFPPTHHIPDVYRVPEGEIMVHRHKGLERKELTEYSIKLGPSNASHAKSLKE